MKVLVTGAAGFIGSHFARLVRETRPGWDVVILDALTYAGHLSTIADFSPFDDSGKKTPFYEGRIEDPQFVATVILAEQPDAIVNFAAESHNDRSMGHAAAFIDSNTLGVYVLLEAARANRVNRFVQVSTDEVYGTIDEGKFTESSPLEPNTPYSAAKAGGDLQARAAFTTYGYNVSITRGGNTYGPYQYPEKLIPFFVTRLIDGKKVPIYGEGNQVREWIHARDHASGVLAVLEHGKAGEAYNVGDVNERTNMEIVRILLEETGRDESLVKRIPDPRQGAHDKRYSMTTDKIQTLGWKPEMNFEQELRATVRWYVENQDWWRPIVADRTYKYFITGYYGRSLGDDL